MIQCHLTDLYVLWDRSDRLDLCRSDLLHRLVLLNLLHRSGR